jgi:hypothetical protein
MPGRMINVLIILQYMLNLVGSSAVQLIVLNLVPGIVPRVHTNSKIRMVNQVFNKQPVRLAMFYTHAVVYTRVHPSRVYTSY